MNQLDNITDQPDQLVLAVLDDASVLQIRLKYNAATQRWTMDVSHPLLNATNIAVCVHPNLLRPWRNLVPFGIACTTLDGADPLSFDDFLGNAALYILQGDDVPGVEQNLMGGLLQ